MKKAASAPTHRSEIIQLDQLYVIACSNLLKHSEREPSRPQAVRHHGMCPDLGMNCFHAFQDASQDFFLFYGLLCSMIPLRVPLVLRNGTYSPPARRAENPVLKPIIHARVPWEQVKIYRGIFIVFSQRHYPSRDS